MTETDKGYHYRQLPTWKRVFLETNIALFAATGGIIFVDRIAGRESVAAAQAESPGDPCTQQSDGSWNCRGTGGSNTAEEENQSNQYGRQRYQRKQYVHQYPENTTLLDGSLETTLNQVRQEMPHAGDFIPSFREVGEAVKQGVGFMAQKAADFFSGGDSSMVTCNDGRSVRLFPGEVLNPDKCTISE